MNTAKAQPQPRNVSFPLEVYHSKRGTHREVFETLKLSVRPATKAQSAIPETDDRYLLFINNETEDINDKMQNYVTQSTIDVYEDEPESPVKVTLEMALSILAEQKVSFFISQSLNQSIHRLSFVASDLSRQAFVSLNCSYVCHPVLSSQVLHGSSSVER